MSFMSIFGQDASSGDDNAMTGMSNHKEYPLTVFIENGPSVELLIVRSDGKVTFGVGIKKALEVLVHQLVAKDVRDLVWKLESLPDCEECDDTN